jgi:tellurite methyltransferase
MNIQGGNLIERQHFHEMGSHPASFLVENIELLPKGRALDLAMGSGYNAMYLAAMGYEVEGIDISPDAINNALQLAHESGITIKAEVADLEGRYRIKRDSYDIIICFHYLQRSLIPQIKDGLKKGGVVVYETFIVDQAKLFGKPRKPDYLLQYNELLTMFSDFRCLRYREGIIENRQAIASIIAQKIWLSAADLT